MEEIVKKSTKGGTCHVSTATAKGRESQVLGA